MNAETFTAADGSTIVFQRIEQAAPPVLISQRTALSCLGFSPRDFLEAAREYAQQGGEVLARGKLRLVQREAFVAWLRTSSSATAKRRPSAMTELDALERELGIGKR